MHQSQPAANSESRMLLKIARYTGPLAAVGLEKTEVIPERITDPVLEPMYLVLIHNDDVTPYTYVLHILESIFMLSDELAEHIAWTAHTQGTAIVVVLPRAGALRIVDRANGRARLDGQPLTFSAEPER